MRALSLWQPHASAIALLIKRYETRGWSTAYRGPLVIHAAKKLFRERDYGFPYCKEVRDRFVAAGSHVEFMRYGAVVCLVDLVDCVPTSEVRGKIGDYEFWGDFRDIGDDQKPLFAFKLENVRKLIPAPVNGRQGFFDIPQDLIKLA